MAPWKKRAARREEEEEEEKPSSNAERSFRGLSDAPVTSKAPKVTKGEERRLIVILEGAMLETVKQGKTFELLNCDRHRGALAKAGRDPGMARPDITHQCLLMLQDSPLNRAGMLQVFVRTQRNALVAIAPQTRIPRTFERFSGLMVQLLHKLNVRNADGKQKLLKVIKNPVTSHLPPGCIKVATSFHADGEPVHPRTLANDDRPIAVVVGAFAHGSVNVDYTEQTVSLSSYPLSAALTCTKLCSAFEEVWGVH